MAPYNDLEVLVISPSSADAGLTCQLLRDAGFTAQALPELQELLPRLPDQAGCAVVVEEALSQAGLQILSDALRQQPDWCDFPFIIVSAEEVMLATLIERLFPYSGNVTLLGRPLSPVTLISAVRVALRARRRQYEVRKLLHEREQSMRQRDEFLAMLAHELRNPLAPIRNATHVLNSLKIDNPMFAKALGLVDRQVLHMTRLVNDLLDVSRLELGKVQLQMQPLDLNEAVKSAADSCAGASQDRAHDVRLRLSDVPLLVNGDLVRVEQIIGNLLTNAIKYTPRGGVITISTSRQGSDAELNVEDTGAGIAAGLEKDIFDLFRQDKRTLARSEGGLGIGLTVVKRLIDLHGGTISALSLGVNKGARFTVRLPLAAEAAAANAASDQRGSDALLSRRVLVVEDSQDIRESLDLLLRMWGHDVYFAETGLEGVERARELEPEVALVDIGLPGMSGYDVAREIRQISQRWSTPTRLIAMTGYGQPKDISDAMNAGFDCHLLKPVDPEILARALAQ